MSEFLKGWRRKVGVVTLVMACALICMWTLLSGYLLLWKLRKRTAVEHA